MAGYQSPGTQARRAATPTDRRAGVDANVSNLALASFPAAHPEQLAIDQIRCDTAQQQAATRAAKQARDRQRALDRSRRNTMLISTGPRRGSGNGPNAAPPQDCQLNKSPTRAGREQPDLTECRYAPTAATHSPQAIGAPASITPLIPQRQSGQTGPGPRDRGADRGVPRQYHHRRGHQNQELGAVVGQEDRPIQSRHARRGPGLPNARPPVVTWTGPAPAPPRCPNIACAGSASPKPWPNAPTGARTAGCKPIVTLSRLPWRPASNSPIPTIRHRARRLPTCPRPTGGAGLPARVGGLSQPAPATNTTRWSWLGQDRQPPPGGLC